MAYEEERRACTHAYRLGEITKLIIPDRKLIAIIIRKPEEISYNAGVSIVSFCRHQKDFENFHSKLSLNVAE